MLVVPILRAQKAPTWSFLRETPLPATTTPVTPREKQRSERFSDLPKVTELDCDKAGLGGWSSGPGAHSHTESG